MERVGGWLIFAPVWLVALLLVVSLTAFAFLGWRLRQREVRLKFDSKESSEQENYILTAVSGLFALLIGFTFSMAIDRFDTRRDRVLDEANAIEATYLKAQLLGEPYRLQISKLLVEYTDNKILLGEARPGARQMQLLAKNEQLKTDLWSQAVSAFPTIKSLDFSSSFIDTMSNIMQLDAARKEGRRAHVPIQVYTTLFIYLLVVATV